MTPHQAYVIASQWGSYINTGDPGACFYGFKFNDGRPKDELNRGLCLAYTQSLIAKVSHRIKHEPEYLKRYRVLAQYRRDLKDLEALLSWFNTCEVAV
jgi:hypothetical protein